MAIAREAEPVGSLQEIKEWGLDREDLLGMYRNMLITRGVEATLAVTEQLALAIVRAVSGKTSAKAIEAAIKSAAKGFGTRKLAAPIEPGNAPHSPSDAVIAPLRCTQSDRPE